MGGSNAESEFLRKGEDKGDKINPNFLQGKKNTHGMT